MDSHAQKLDGRFKITANCWQHGALYQGNLRSDTVRPFNPLYAVEHRREAFFDSLYGVMRYFAVSRRVVNQIATANLKWSVRNNYGLDKLSTFLVSRNTITIEGITLSV